MGIFENIPIDKIKVGKRFRKDNGNLSHLAASIDRDGLINPITVCRLSDGFFLLLAGCRRLEACRLLKWTHIDANVIEISEDAITT